MGDVTAHSFPNAASLVANNKAWEARRQKPIDIGRSQTHRHTHARTLSTFITSSSHCAIFCCCFLLLVDVSRRQRFTDEFEPLDASPTFHSSSGDNISPSSAHCLSASIPPTALVSANTFECWSISSHAPAADAVPASQIKVHGSRNESQSANLREEHFPCCSFLFLLQLF